MESASAPSEVADPLMVSRLLAPAAPVGSGIVCTSAPAGVYSSRKTGAAEPDSAVPPSPSRATTTLPAVNPAAGAGEASSTATTGITSEPTTEPTSTRRNFERTANSSGGGPRGNRKDARFRNRRTEEPIGQRSD